jgi:hypothetical protein
MKPLRFPAPWTAEKIPGRGHRAPDGVEADPVQAFLKAMAELAADG